MVHALKWGKLGTVIIVATGIIGLTGTVITPVQPIIIALVMARPIVVPNRLTIQVHNQ